MVRERIWQKHALLIGIDEYLHPYFPSLQGCVNDARLMEAVLRERYSFPASNITRLENHRATGERIRTELSRLAQQAHKDDLIVVCYSGHGSRMTDREGTSPNALDETIVPYDSGRRSHRNTDISDDELRAWLVRIGEHKPFVMVLLDTCHSGGSSRDLFGPIHRQAMQDTRPVSDLPPSPLAPLGVPGLAGAEGEWRPANPRHVVISACRAGERAYEHHAQEGQSVARYGALSYFLGRELWNAHPGNTLRDVFEQARIQVTAVRPHQHPRLEADEPAGLASVEIRALCGEPASATCLDRAGHRGLAPNLQAAQASSSDHEDTSAVVEIVPPQGQDGYQGYIAGLAACLEASPCLRRAELPDIGQYDVRAYLLAPRQEVVIGDHVPGLGAIAEPTWAVVGPDGMLAMPAFPANRIGVAREIRCQLEKWLRYRQLLALSNPRGNCLTSKVRLELLQQAPDGRWFEAIANGQNGDVMVSEGDAVAARVVNECAFPIHVGLLDFALAGEVRVLCPATGGQSLTIAASSEQIVGLRTVEASGPGQPGAPGRAEYFKLIATTRPIDFSMLGFERHGEPHSVPDSAPNGDDAALLEQILQAAPASPPASPQASSQTNPDAPDASASADWLTLTRSFFVRQYLQRPTSG